MLFQKLYEFFKQLICGFRMILYLSIVVSLRELVHVPMDCGVGSVGGEVSKVRRIASCTLSPESTTSSPFGVISKRRFPVK